ncbi:MAG: hypothetical protein ACIALR_09155, partial [Blastopirellula sp. JB062]
ENQEAGSRVVLVKKSLDDWKFNVLVTLAEDEMSIGLTMPLSTLKDEAKLSNSQLIKLLAANQQYAPSVFTFSAARRRTELFRTLPNESLTGRTLRDAINQMAILAKRTVDLWKMPGGNVSAEPSQPAESKSTSLLGAWSAAKSPTEAIAIRFNPENKFRLVYVKSGRQTQSTGKYDLKGETLSLIGDDGIRLAGQFQILSNTEFRFTPSAAIGTLKFAKAK